MRVVVAALVSLMWVLAWAAAASVVRGRFRDLSEVDPRGSPPPVSESARLRAGIVMPVYAAALSLAGAAALAQVLLLLDTRDATLSRSWLASRRTNVHPVYLAFVAVSTTAALAGAYSGMALAAYLRRTSPGPAKPFDADAEAAGVLRWSAGAFLAVALPYALVVLSAPPVPRTAPLPAPGPQ
jgi:hypothetical protein